jgi:hypothetical protein
VSAQTAQAGTVVNITLHAGASAVDNFYNGWWLKITSGTGINQVRRIKSYIGATKIASVFTTADHTALPGIPQEGLDFTVSPDNTSIFNLYNTPFVASFWDESLDEYSFAYTAQNPAANGQVIIADYLKMKTGDLSVIGELSVDTINEYTLNAGVTIEGVNFNSGLINNSSPDTVVEIILARDSTTYATVANIPSNGTYMVMVSDSVSPNTGTHAIFMLAGNNTNQTVQRMLSTTATGGARLTMQWTDGASPEIRHSPAYSSGTGNITYKLKIIKVV